jgi:poly [ADP-ribose] polymerase
MANIVERHKFSMTKLGENNNKYWNVVLYDDGTVEAEWGRQGKTRQSGTWSGGRSYMDKKIREKKKKGYIENETVEGTGTVSAKSVQTSNLKDIARKQIKYKNPLVQKLVDYFVKVNAHQIVAATGGKISFDTSSATFKTTQGIIVPAQVNRARVLLSDLADMVADADWSNYDFEDALNEYMSLIPRDIGMKRTTPRAILPDLATIQRENALLDGLDASFAGVIKAPQKTTKKKTKAPKLFEVDLFMVVDKNIIKNISNMFEKTKKRNHVTRDYRVKEVYAIRIKNMSDAFEKRGKPVGNIMQLWHGTKASNLLSIFRQGLIIPPSSSAHCTGRMYGNGLYFSCISTKALNYATNFWGGGGNTSRVFMFLADVAMGNPYMAGSGWGSHYPRSGTDSTWAKGGQSGVINDEMIVYKLHQANLIYLVEFE